MEGSEGNRLVPFIRKNVYPVLSKLSNKSNGVTVNHSYIDLHTSFKLHKRL